MPTKKQYTKEEINEQIETTLADNSTQAITASDVRSIVKDYITASTYAPVLIYSGLLQGGIPGPQGRDAYVQDKYFNPDFFQEQYLADPTSPVNIYQLSSTNVSASNGTYIVATIDGSASGRGLELKFTVSNGAVLSMEVTKHGGGYTVGNEIDLTLGSTNLTITYNGAIRHDVAFDFIMTTNINNTFRDHRGWNTLGYSVSSNEIAVGDMTRITMYRLAGV